MLVFASLCLFFLFLFPLKKNPYALCNFSCLVDVRVFFCGFFVLFVMCVCVFFFFFFGGEGGIIHVFVFVVGYLSSPSLPLPFILI